jgi:cell division protein FtsB
MRRPFRRRPRLHRWLALAALLLIGLLYYSPVRSYFETRGALAGRLAEVKELRRERAALARGLAERTSAATLERQARRLGFVRPGERLFVVKGIQAWRRAEARPAKARLGSSRRAR